MVVCEHSQIATFFSQDYFRKKFLKYHPLNLILITAMGAQYQKLCISVINV